MHETEPTGLPRRWQKDRSEAMRALFVACGFAGNGTSAIVAALERLVRGAVG